MRCLVVVFEEKTTGMFLVRVIIINTVKSVRKISVLN